MMSKIVHGLHFNNLRGDFFGGLVAAVIALPLALAFGVASGAGPWRDCMERFFLGLWPLFSAALPRKPLARPDP